MKINKHFLTSATFVSLLALPTVQAQVAAPAKSIETTAIETLNKKQSSSVVTISKVVGRTLVDFPNGQRMRLKPGMILPEDARILVWSKGVVEGVYNRSKCEFKIEPGTGVGSTLNIKNGKQCPSAVSVINPEKYARFFGASNPGCCVTKTVGLGDTLGPSGCCVVRLATPAELASTASSIGVSPSTLLPPVTAALPPIPAVALSSINPFVLAGLAGGGALLVSDSDDPKPLSPQ